MLRFDTFYSIGGIVAKKCLKVKIIGHKLITNYELIITNYLKNINLIICEWVNFDGRGRKIGQERESLTLNILSKVELETGYLIFLG